MLQSVMSDEGTSYHQMVLLFIAQTEVMTNKCEATEENMRQLTKTPKCMLSPKRLDDLGLLTSLPTRSKQCL